MANNILMHKNSSFDKEYFMLKFITPDSVADGEPYVLPMTKSGNELTIDDRRFKRVLACDELLKAASLIIPEPDKKYIAVIALGDSEHWGNNKNGDSFPYNALMGKDPLDVNRNYFDRYSHRIPTDWGYKTFLNGHVFSEHMNRNPVYSKGDIHAAVWNEDMHRVELIISILLSKFPELFHRISGGFLPNVSMACRVPFDRCSICGNLAPTAPYYCDDIKRYRNMMLSHGKVVSMINDYPVYFDLSIVNVPAAEESGTLMKVAKKHDFYFSSPNKKQANVEDLLVTKNVLEQRIGTQSANELLMALGLIKAQQLARNLISAQPTYYDRLLNEQRYRILGPGKSAMVVNVPAVIFGTAAFMHPKEVSAIPLIAGSALDTAIVGSIIDMSKADKKKPIKK